MKDYGKLFEEVVNHFVKKPTYITYADYWQERNERIALLYTACLIAYDQNQNDSVLENYLTQVFNDDDEKTVSTNCLNRLNELKGGNVSNL